MTSSSPAPKLPLWIFYGTDAVLLTIAVLLGTQRPRPWSETTIVAIVACIIAGAIIGLVPLIIYYERQKNEMLDDRQRALEALARTVANSAEQISIAAGGLHEIAELAQRNLKHAEQLPHKLQEKIAEFQVQLANASDTEKEELEKELEELRSTETERLQSTSDKIAKTAAEFAKLEAATQQHLTAANEAVAKLAFGTANAIGKAQAAAEQALAQARQEAARALGDSAGRAVKEIEHAKAHALSELAAEFGANAQRIKEATQQLGGMVEQLTAAAKAMPVSGPAASLHATLPEPPAGASATADAAAAESARPQPEAPAPAAESQSTPTKRPRKPRHETPTASPEATPPAESAPLAAEPATTTAPRTSQPPLTEPPPVPAETIPEVAPVTPPTPPPFSTNGATHASAAEPTAPAEPAPGLEATRTPRKRAARKSEDEQPGLGLELEESHDHGDDTGSTAGIVERVLSSDGATRLIVTAYIGIGNRLFIRGSGPGLSWDKGVPLQFVSIGKWRWETNDASARIRFKLLKNDEQESSAPGELTLDPGHQQEVTANFN